MSPHTSPACPQPSRFTAPPSWSRPWHTSALIGDNDAGYPAFTTLTPHLTDTDRHRHWASLLDAAARQLALDDPSAGAAAALDLFDNAEAAGGSAAFLLDVDAELYRAVNPADRPGENDYDGYDIAALALGLSTVWATELVRRARAAVDPSPRLTRRSVVSPAPIWPRTV